MAKKIVIPIIVIIVAAAAGYYFIQEKVVKKVAEDAVSQERSRWEQKTEQLEDKLALLEKELQETEPAIADEKLTEVFGEIAVETPTAKTETEQLDVKITNFFEYIDQKGYLKKRGIPLDSASYVDTLIERLKNSRPVVSGETKDLYTLLKNITYFFRVLGKKDIQVIKDILQGESDIIEPTAKLFFDWLDPWKENAEGSGVTIAPELLYEYSAFFLNTIAGQSYLFRRGSKTRCLTTYYCILVLEEANKRDLNKYGIDIRPHVAALIDDIESRKQLADRIDYLTRLYEIKKKYTS